MNIDLNLRTNDTETVVCRHCGATVGQSVSDPMSHARHHHGPSTAAGPGVHADPAAFTDRTILLRQAFCPGCLVLLATEIVPDDEPTYRVWSLT